MRKINIKIKPQNFTLILFKVDSKNKEIVERIETKSQRRFYRKMKLIPNKINAYLRVYYSDKNFNDGEYLTKKDLINAYMAFIED